MMIKLDFAIAVSIFLSIPLALVFIPWMFYNCREDGEGLDQSQYVQQCPYCTYIFFDYQKVQLKTCPRCHSLITKES